MPDLRTDSPTADQDLSMDVDDIPDHMQEWSRANPLPPPPSLVPHTAVIGQDLLLATRKCIGVSSLHAQLAQPDDDSGHGRLSLLPVLQGREGKAINTSPGRVQGGSKGVRLKSG